MQLIVRQKKSADSYCTSCDYSPTTCPFHHCPHHPLTPFLFFPCNKGLTYVYHFFFFLLLCCAVQLLYRASGWVPFFTPWPHVSTHIVEYSSPSTPSKPVSTYALHYLRLATMRVMRTRRGRIRRQAIQRSWWWLWPRTMGRSGTGEPGLCPASTSVAFRVTLRTCSCRLVNHIENERANARIHKTGPFTESPWHFLINFQGCCWCCLFT